MVIATTPNVRKNPLKEAALQYAAAGMAVFPCHTVRFGGNCSCGHSDCDSQGKHPRWDADLFPHGLQSASSDPVTVAAFWDKWPDANIGFRTGNGRIVIDVDPKNGGNETLRLLENEHGTLPDTLTTVTGSGGAHYHFASDAPVLSRAHSLGDGVDIKAEGGYVILPPSYHMSGRNYEWDGANAWGDAEVAELPEWVVMVANQYAPRKRTSTGPTQAGELYDNPLIQGARNEQLFSLAGSMRHYGASEDEILARLMVINDTEVDPPLAERELRTIAKSASKYAPSATAPQDEDVPAPDTTAVETFDALPLTERGNADRLLLRFGSHLRYTAARHWLYFDGKRWCDDDGHAERYAKAVARELWQAAARASSVERRKDVARFAIQSERYRSITACLSLAASDAQLRMTSDAFDTHQYALNCNNGVVDLRTGSLEPHRPDWYFTRLSPVDFNPSADCPRWHRFLIEIFDGDQDLISYIQRVCGYWLTGDIGEQVMWFFWGDGQNGKSTILNVIKHVMGDYSVSTPAATFAEQRSETVRNDIARLTGARLVTAAEGSESRRLNEALVKQLTGGDPLIARFLHREYFSFIPTFKPLLVTNHKPKITGTDFGIWRRVHLVPFTVQIPDDRKNPHLTEELIAEEAEGILAWMVAGTQAWLRNGLTAPTVVREATDQYRKESDVFGQFLSECCVLGEEKQVTFAMLYAAYQTWCQQGGYHPMAAVGVGKELTRRKFEERRTDLARWRKGLDLRPGYEGKPDR